MTAHRKYLIVASLYAAVGLVTFGREGARYGRYEASLYCQRKPDVMRDPSCDVAWLSATIAAIVWPAYWSWELQS